MDDGLCTRLLFELKRAKAFYVVALTAVVAISGLVYFKMTEPQVEGVETTATIVGFSTHNGHNSRLTGDGLIVLSAMSPDGLLGRIRVTYDQIQGCSVGDELPAIARGLNLQVQPRPCLEDD